MLSWQPSGDSDENKTKHLNILEVFVKKIFIFLPNVLSQIKLMQVKNHTHSSSFFGNAISFKQKELILSNSKIPFSVISYTHTVIITHIRLILTFHDVQVAMYKCYERYF